jgi:DNA-binding NarL/FixJ family response regulator
MRKTVFIVEDDRALREQLVQILDTAPDIKCVKAVATGEEALREIPLNPPDVVLMDINLPKMSGIECAAELKKLVPAIEIVMLTVYEDAERIFRALRAGASSYLIKSSPPHVLFDAIRQVHGGGSALSSSIARKVVQHFQARAESSRPAENLSPREREVLEFLASGYIYKEIADKMGIGVETVRTYVKSICVKMHVRSRIEAVAKHRSEQRW